MTDEKHNTHEREVRVLRDWLIPSTLIVAICVSIILYILTLSPLTPLLKSSAIAALTGTALLIYNLLFIFGVLGEMELKKYKEYAPNFYFSTTYVISLIGTLAFMVSLSLLCFTRSLLLGIISSALSIIIVVATIWIAVKYG